MNIQFYLLAIVWIRFDQTSYRLKFAFFRYEIKSGFCFWVFFGRKILDGSYLCTDCKIYFEKWCGEDYYKFSSDSISLCCGHCFSLANFTEGGNGNLLGPGNPSVQSPCKPERPWYKSFTFRYRHVLVYVSSRNM